MRYFRKIGVFLLVSFGLASCTSEDEPEPVPGPLAGRILLVDSLLLPASAARLVIREPTIGGEDTPIVTLNVSGGSGSADRFTIGLDWFSVGPLTQVQHSIISPEDLVSFGAQAQSGTEAIALLIGVDSGGASFTAQEGGLSITLLGDDTDQIALVFSATTDDAVGDGRVAGTFVGDLTIVCYIFEEEDAQQTQDQIEDTQFNSDFCQMQLATLGVPAP